MVEVPDLESGCCRFESYHRHVKIKTEVKLDWDEPISLNELLELVKGEDPEKVIIASDFEVPDWTRLVIYVRE